MDAIQCDTFVTCMTLVFDDGVLRMVWSGAFAAWDLPKAPTSDAFGGWGGLGRDVRRSWYVVE